MTDLAHSAKLEPYRARETGLVLGRTRIARIAGKGYALVATAEIDAAELIEENLCLALDARDLAKVDATRLRHYVYFWGMKTGDGELALAIGNLSFCNHSAEPNATIEIDKQHGVIALRARMPIRAGTEITIDYGYPLDFAVEE